MADLTANQARAIACVLSTRTVEQAAECAGVGKRTLERWLTLPAFVAALDDAKAKIVSTTTGELEKLSLAATSELWRILEQPAQNKDRLRAVGLILTNAIKWREETDLIGRIAAIEQTIGDVKK